MAREAEFPTWLAASITALSSWSGGLEAGVYDPAVLMGLVNDVEKAARMLGVIKALLAEEAVRRDAWRSSGARSPEAWFAKVTGTSVGAARRKLTAKERMSGQPDVDEAWRKGDLSDDQAERVAEATAEDPAAGRRLVERAKRCTARQLAEDCDRTKAAKRSAADEERRRRRMHEERSCRTWVDRDGTGRLDARLPPERLAELRACIDPFARTEFEAARAEGRRESHDAYRADALLAMARAATSDTGAPHADPSAGGGRGAAGAPGGRRPDHPPATVTAIISLEALRRGFPMDGETCHLDGIGPVPVSTVKDLMADAFLSAVVTDGTDIRTVVHLGRHPTTRQHTALTVRDPCCVVPGCASRDGLEIDHVTGWAATHTTHLDDLARLCRRHHRMKTYQGWTLTGPPGHWSFTPPGHTPPATTSDPPRTGPHPPLRPDDPAAHDRTGATAQQTDLFAEVG